MQNNNSVIDFDSFGVEHIPKEIKEFVKNKNIITNIFRIQAFNSICVDIFVLVLLILSFQEKL